MGYFFRLFNPENFWERNIVHWSSLDWQMKTWMHFLGLNHLSFKSICRLQLFLLIIHFFCIKALCLHEMLIFTRLLVLQTGGVKFGISKRKKSACVQIALKSRALDSPALYSLVGIKKKWVNSDMASDYSLAATAHWIQLDPTSSNVMIGAFWWGHLLLPLSFPPCFMFTYLLTSLVFLHFKSITIPDRMTQVPLIQQENPHWSGPYATAAHSTSSRIFLFQCPATTVVTLLHFYFVYNKKSGSCSSTLHLLDVCCITLTFKKYLVLQILFTIIWP